MGRKKKKSPRKPQKTWKKSELIGKVTTLLRGSPDKLYNYKQVASRIGIENGQARKAVLEILEGLVDSGMAESPSTGKFRIHASQMALVRAKMDFTKTGAAYAVPDEGNTDIYISERNTGFALHGDTVELSLIGSRRGQPEGKVTKVLTRGAENYVGTIELSKHHAFFVPSNPRIHVDFYIDKQKTKGARNGQKVIVKLLDWKEKQSSPEAEVVTVLGEPGINEVEMHAILVEFNLPYEFPPEVVKEAERISVEIPEEEIKKRRDFRSHETFTIDPDDAKDFDDALSIRENDDGTFEVGVHIADVSHYVVPGSILEKEAEKRATSVYLVDRVVPMLPEILSNVVCSLRPDEEKLCMSAVFRLNKNGDILKRWFGKTIIKSNRRFTYDDAQKIIEGKDKNNPHAQAVLMFHEWAKKYRRQRMSKGALEFSGTEVKFKLDESGKPIGVYEKVMKDANFLIEEFMLLANLSVAEHIGKPEKGKEIKNFVYRVHDLPDPEKLKMLKDFVQRLGYKLRSTKPEEASRALNDLLDQVKDKPEEDVVKVMAIRSMAKAIYTTENIGHYGLAFDFYTHFTSPIRRYPDVLVHRLLMRYSKGESSVKKDSIEKKCKHSSDMEKRASDAERASIKYKQVEFMLDKIGQLFDGHISGLTRWGMFVEIVDTKVEGMIPLSTMDDDIYRYDEKKNRIVGQRYKEVFEFGDKVRIKVNGADLLQKQLDFRLS